MGSTKSLTGYLKFTNKIGEVIFNGAVDEFATTINDG
jgi:hypothetical protein